MFVGFKVLASKGIDAPEVFKVLRVFSIGGGGGGDGTGGQRMRARISFTSNCHKSDKTNSF